MKGKYIQSSKNGKYGLRKWKKGDILYLSHENVTETVIGIVFEGIFIKKK